MTAHTHYTMLLVVEQCCAGLTWTSAREYVFRVFLDFKKHDFYVFLEMTYQKVVKSHYLTFSPQCVKSSSCVSLSDHCNSIPSSLSVIHSEPFFQRVSIACYAKRCISYRKSKSVCLSVSLSHPGTVSQRLKLRSWGLHWRIAQ